jgi:hypothetical protein
MSYFYPGPHGAQGQLDASTERDFDEYRRYHAHEAWKYAMWEAGCLLPTQTADGRSLCFCGAEIEIAGLEQHISAAHTAGRKKS